MHRRNLTFLFALLSIAVGVAQIISSYSVTAQGFDEPCHVAAGLEFLTQGKYQLDPVHPPLSRVAIALPLYLAGVKYPDFSPSDPGRLNYNVVGNRILFDDHHYVRNLTLARLGVLPAFVLSALVVFYWTRGLYGDLASVVAVAMFTSSPVILTFSSLAYTDMFAASTQCTACFVFALWMEKPSWNATALLGAAVGLALLAKFTTVLFLASAFLCMLLIYFWLRQERRFSWNCLRPLTRKALVAGIISFTMLWAGYGFSVGHVQQTMNLSPDNPPSFEHFPAALRNVAHKLIAENAVLPAPELLRGLATAWVLNKTAPMSYLLEQNKRGGWWYFFPFAVLVKSTVPFLILALIGVGFAAQRTGDSRWRFLMPAAAALGIFLISMPVSYNVGVRHVLVIFPLFAVLTGAGTAHLWTLRTRWKRVGQFAVIVLLTWQAAISIRLGRDFTGYFNQFAGPDPSKVLVMGCDLDCGEDLFRLRDALRQRNIQYVKLAVWTSAELDQLDLPPYEILLPNNPQTGWIAVSLRALRHGDVLHKSYPPDGLKWLEAYQPEEKVGTSILLYHITSAR